ncbi:MAG: type III pantothenate kinase [Tepidanaerobacteraceae bacterium]|jgi:type III pantothenate kinase|nr:type III pantothenate kinase [Tepidanaerobacteraceae bacterium]
MLLAVDVGNTNIVFGTYDGQDLITSWRMATHREQTEDEYGIMLKSLLRDADIEFGKINGAIISSVVPPLTPVMERMCERYFSTKALVVGPGIKTGINIKYENPREVGADRIVNAVAAHHKYGGPAIIVDFGTATTFDAVTAGLDYLGGAIAPGIGISTDALFKSAARLYRVEIAKPDRIIGRNTSASMQAGIFYGYVGLVDSIVDRMKQEMGGGRIITVATGGLAPLICSETRTIDEVDMLLTLDGLRLLYEKNCET